jgi:CxxC motif-containing protein (DUF1111 family)
MGRTVRVMVVVWASALAAAIALNNDQVETQSAQATEAPTGFTGSNGFLAEFCANQASLVNSPNSPMIPEDECNAAAAAGEFTGPETVADGLGPIFNGVGCGECHVVPTLGGSTQLTEKRAGFFDGEDFIEHPGGSLIQDRSTVPGFQEVVFPGATNVMTLRATISIFGDGFVEALSNTTLQNIASNQPQAQRGQIINVPVLERPGQTRIGRFGWKGQQASLLSFSADAYKNEMGITSPLEPIENTSNGTSVEEFDLPGVDDEGVDVELFALFMRDTKAPPVNPRLVGNRDARDGSQLFNNIGCAVCHTRTLTTAAPGTFINGGALRVANALGNKIIHPFSDFLLHDIGTGDGIVQNGGPSTRNKVRTPPLWGLHTRGRFMHDASSFSLNDAIDRHRGQASSARSAFFGLSNANRNRLITFLQSL